MYVSMYVSINQCAGKPTARGAMSTYVYLSQDRLGGDPFGEIQARRTSVGWQVRVTQAHGTFASH